MDHSLLTIHEMKIAFTIDENFIEPLAVTLRSFLNFHSNEILDFFLVCNQLSNTNKEKINQMITGYSATIRIIELEGINVDHLKVNLHFAKSNYYRLLLPDYIQEDKVLYLDADLLIRGSLLEVWNTDIEDYHLAAVQSPGLNWHQDLGVSRESGYFNSGVMLINLKKWRETDFSSKVIDYIGANPNAIWFADQCGLNALSVGKWKKLPFRFNVTTNILENDFPFPEDESTLNKLKEALKTPAVIHFTGPSKPWHTENRHPYKWNYWRDLSETPFKRFFPSDFNAVNFFKFFLPLKTRRSLQKLREKIHLTK